MLQDTHTPKQAISRRSFTGAGLVLGAATLLGLQVQQGRAAQAKEQAGASSAADSSCTNSSTCPHCAAHEASAAQDKDSLASTSGTVTTSLDLSSYAQGSEVRAWLPLAQNYDHQCIRGVAFEAPGADEACITTDSSGSKALYLAWGPDADPASRKATLSFHATRSEVRVTTITDAGGELPEEVQAYLGSSTLVPLNDQVITAAEDIVKGAQDNLAKAKAIYEWIIQNMERDESVEGCGTGDICTLLSSRKGKCTDINSVFVGLCRAVGIPARELFGIRMNAEDISKNQHCWADFYLNGAGWVPADPADVLKAVLKGGWTKDQAETRERADYFWGGYDSERVQLSYGRDITLEPAQNAPALNYFGYPYAEVDGLPLDSYDPDSFVYQITFEADSPAS